ncbi:hypothetical protein B0J13DRAFT_560759 [Dactylonectria estremocensis]|uniref:PWI domain-containing protein n=1 Tax=Dactylonectria estremocensis TaxID=1079267 RepID=A0A9P9IXI3_9HYPO|nr:hypothetical protein B0J13DRAFT_560759 [Dactylonectria estremocensis]
MAFNPYGNNPYGAPPAYGGYPGSNNAAPGMAPPPGLGPPPGMSSAPGMAPPGVQQSSATQANRPSGLPPNFQAPVNMPNINFNAPVIRLGTAAGKSGSPAMGGRGDGMSGSSGGGGGRQGLGMERGMDQGRAAAREVMQVLVPPSNEEKLRTIFIHQISEGVGGDEGVERLLSAVGKLRKWDAAVSVMEEHRGSKFGFAQFEDTESLAVAIKVLHDEEVQVPKKRQQPSGDAPKDDTFEGIDKVKLQVTVDPNSVKYVESYEEGRDDSGATERIEAARAALKGVIRDMFYPTTAISDKDISMGNTDSGENVEVVNIPLAQDDELADIPAEMREVVSQEIAAFRERSTRRDMERLKREEEMEEQERQRNGAPRPSRLDSPPPGANIIPLGPRGSVPNAPSGPKGQNGQNRIAFVNGGVSNTDYSVNREDEDTDADDEELHRRQQSKAKADADKMYLEAERKWGNRERSRQAALERERDRDRQDAESLERRKQEQLDREKAWDDEKESSRKSHPYYRDHGDWVRKRGTDRAEEEARDEADRRAENDEQRREQAAMERARGMADSFLDKQAHEMEERQAPSVTAPQPFKLSLGAAAQKAQASRAAPQRRTIAEVEGLLDDEEADASTKRQLIPIQFEPTSASASMTEEEISQAVRALAQEIPSNKDGLWEWKVKWDYMEDAIVRDKLRPFVEKKIVEYLGVQEEMLVEAVEEHLRKHGTAAALVEELEGALDDEAEDLVKKLWRMVIFFTECEKRGLPA